MADIASLGIKITTQGAKEAARDLDRLTKEARASEGAAKRIGKAWGVALGVGVVGAATLGVAALKKYVANSIEAERVQAQLNATLRSTKGAAGLAIGELNNMADALQAVTTFDDEAIGGVQGLLLTFTKIHRDVFPKATEAVLDMSIALGTDLRSAALQVGKALNDPVLGVTALSRAGVQFSEEQKKVIKALVETGRVTEAQAIVLRELETQMGGSARAAANTLGGSIEQLKNAFDNLLEGDASGGGLKETRDTVQALTRTLNDPAIKAGVDSIASGVLKIASAAVQAIASVGGLITALRDLQAQDSDKTYLGLLAKRAKLEEDLANKRKGFTVGLGNANDPIAKLLFGDSRDITNGGGGRSSGNPEIDRLERSLAEIDRQLASRRTDKLAEDAVAAAFAGLKGTPPTGGDPPVTPPTGGGNSDRAARALPDFAKDAADDLRRMVEETAAADLQFQSLAATLEGPLAEAAFRHKEALAQIEEAGTKAGRSSAEIAAAKSLETARYEEETRAIEAQLNPARQLIDEKEFELSLLRMTAAERMTAIDLRHLEGRATDEQVAAIRELNQAYDDEQQKVALMDGFRASMVDGLTDAVTGTKSLKDAFKDMLDDIAAQITRFIANKWIEQLFGQQGTSGGGSSGGWLGGLMGAFFGGGSGSSAGTVADLFSGSGFGFASGGYTGPGGRNQVAGVVHAGEYVLNADAVRRLPRDYLDALNSGASPAMGGSNVTHIHVAGAATRETIEQIDRANGRRARRAMARTGG